jgi:hypothetical protein
MIHEGASKLFGADTVRLLFASTPDAEAARARLAERLPGSKPVWVTRVEDRAHASPPK